MTPRNRPEDAIQLTVAGVLDAAGIAWFHPPLGGYRTTAEGAILKSLGAKAGIPDIIIFDPPPCSPICPTCGRPEAPGAFDEIKAGKNQTEPEQDAWHRVLWDRDWLGGVSRGIDDTLDKLRGLGYPIGRVS